MKEAKLRKWHRTLGMIFALFILIQAATGLILTIEDMLGVYWGGIVHEIHRQYELVGHLYRLIAGVGMLIMVFTGSLIGYKVHQRTKQ